MITLDKLTVQISNKIFNPNTQKYLRIQTQNFIIKTKSPAKPISQTSLQWQQSIQLPLIYGQQMPFQIHDKHQFGYNPQEIQSILHGNIVFIQGNDKFHNWQIFDVNQKKVGYFSVNIKNKPVKAVTVQKNDTKNPTVASPVVKKVIDQTQLVIISSIVVNMPSIKAKRAYAVISVGQHNYKTSPAKSKSGQLVFIQKYELDKNPSINQGFIDIYSCATDQPDQKIGTAKFQLQKRIDIKLKFVNKQNQQIGQGFIDGKIQLKTQALTNKLFAIIVKQRVKNQFSGSQINYKTLKDKMFNDLSRSLISHSSFMRSSGTSLTKSGKRMSVINHNNNIKIPQQKRFFSSRDPANNKCSYLQQRSFQFKQKQVDKYYRGASIGFGQKADFTLAKKSVPSVGKYHLPSIWDRY